MVEFRCYQPADLPGLVEAWNDCFAGGPNFTRVTESDLQRRVMGQPSFDPAAMLVACKGARLLGFVHWGPRSNLRSHLPERRVNRAEGHTYVVVAPKGDRGLIADLLAAAESHLRSDGARRILLGLSWVYGGQPYYNGIAGAYEIPGLSPAPDDLIAVASESGFAPIAEYGTPDLAAERLADLRELAAGLRLRAREWGLRKETRLVESAFFPPRVSVELLSGREVVAMTAFGLWEEYAREYGRRLYGLTSVQVAVQWRGLGLGKLVVIEAMETAREQGAEAFHLHVWRANAPAWNLYHQALGFQPTHRWITLEKVLTSPPSNRLSG